MNTPGKPHKPFSMIREFQLADWFTLGNALCGTGAIFSAISFVQTGATRHLHFAAALILAALVFDVLDGRVARWRQQASSLGRELDSLADVISFGVAPAMLAYASGMQGFFDRIVLAYFVAWSATSKARRFRPRSFWSRCWRSRPGPGPCARTCGSVKPASPA